MTPVITEDILLPYQKRWIEDESPVKLWEKSRRIGASYVEALDSVMCAAKSRDAGGQNTYYLSYNKEMTQQFVQDCAFWARHLDAIADEMEETVLSDGDKDITVYRIRFASGYEIWGMPSEPRSLRSKQGRVIIDEAAFVESLGELLKAAMAMLMWGGVVRILSTHNGDDNPYNELIKEVRDGKLDYSLHSTTIDDALEDGLYRRICLVTSQLWSAEAERKWRDALFARYGDGAEEELRCIPTKSGRRYFSRALLDAIADDEITIVRYGQSDDFTWEKQSRRERAIDKWFRSEVRPILRQFEKPVYFGEDFARSGDLTVLWFYELVSIDSMPTRCVIEMRNLPFAQQWQAIKLMMEELPNFGAAAFDSRGNGQMIAELAAQEWPGYVYQVMLSRSWYQENFPRLKTRIEDQETTVPKDSFLIDDFRVVGLKQGVPQVLEHTGHAKEKRHGDGAIAACLGLYAMNEDEEGGYQPLTYESIDVLNPYREEERDPWH